MRQPPVIARIKAFAADRSGATVVEYGLIAAAIAGAILIVNRLLQSSLSDLATELAAALSL
ncbi:hypothetical protein AUC70_15810 [Methyloceanibacter stevinii]|uniref:Pilus assembly protein n=1 Tax=Methyloceanibacter stevinii TaxID=1774970 RepID=A0A1E3VS40_9HYPH|nr:Flp family type IVb pilin [Methyloceanibacter stevinii]ODR96344.1 hypothetical protein AUC70_15810 [Methyloceanibacter stevinii]